MASATLSLEDFEETFDPFEENELDTFGFDFREKLEQFSVCFEKPREPTPPPYIPSADFECMICMADYTFEEMYFVDVCDHLFCQECIRVHCAKQVQDGAIHISCPFPKCPVELEHHEIMGLLVQEDPKLAQKYDDLLYEHAIRVLKDIVICPAPDCGTPVPLDEQAKWHKCLKCKYLFCHKCMLDHHPDFTCEQWKKVGGKVESFDDYLKIKGDSVKRCPRCNYFVEKNGGCNRICCQKCKCNFCWLCTSDLGDDMMKSYNHFDNGKCKKFDNQ